MSSTAATPSSRRRHRSRRGKGKKVKGHLTKSYLNVFGDPVVQPRFPTNLQSENRVYDFIQYIDQAQLTAAGPLSSNAAGITASYAFALSMLAQAATFTSLFDQYRFAMVEMTFLPRVSTIDQSTAAAALPNSGLVYSYVDNDDAAASSLTLAQQRNNTLVVPGYQKFSHTFKLHSAQTGYNSGGGGATIAVNIPAPWIDSASTTVAGYGLKVLWTAAQAYYAYDIVTRVHLQFRNIQ